MRMRKPLLIAAAVVVAAAAGAGAWWLTASARKGTAVAATVNGEAVLWSQVDAEVSRAAAQFGVDPKNAAFQQQRDEITKSVMDQLIGARLIMQEARRRNLTAPDAEVEQQVAEIKKRFPTERDFTEALARNGFTLTSLREAIRVQKTQRRLADQVARGSVTDQEVRDFFERNRSRFDKPAQLKVSHILFRITEKDQESVAWAKIKIVQVKLADGEKFEDLARKYSEDTASAPQGGNLGYVARGTLVKEFEEAAWALRPGQTSAPVRTQYGLHIIRAFDTKPAEAADFEKVKDEIREQLLASKREKAFSAWLDEQRKAAKIEKFERK